MGGGQRHVIKWLLCIKIAWIWNVRIPEITDSTFFILHMRKHALSALPTIIQLVHGRTYVSGSIPRYKIVFPLPPLFFFLKQNESYCRSSIPQIFWFIIGSLAMNVKIFMLRIRNEVCLKWFWELHCILFFKTPVGFMIITF